MTDVTRAELLPVIQVDRYHAALYAERHIIGAYQKGTSAAMSAGMVDDDPLVQAFTAFRHHLAQHAGTPETGASLERQGGRKDMQVMASHIAWSYYRTINPATWIALRIRDAITSAPLKNDEVVDGWGHDSRFVHTSGADAGVVEPWAETDAIQNSRANGMDEGATFCIEALAGLLKVSDYEQCDGTEEWHGDVRGTLYNVLVAAKVLDPEDGRIAALASRDQPGGEK